jgi:hypothetical protein
MKAEILRTLESFETDLRKLRKNISLLTGTQVSRQGLRTAAEELATRWVEELRSPLEHKFHIAKEIIAETSESLKRLHVLSRPNNLKSSYLKVLDSVLDHFKDKFVLPIQQTSTAVESKFDLQKLVVGLSNPDESEYLKEAVDCANAGFHRAAIVLGWCAAVDRMQKRIQVLGFATFNASSTSLKNQSSGRHKRWNKEFNITTLGELQKVFDNDLITVCEGMGLLDSNQADRLVDVDFQYRNHSAHPGEAPIDDPHLVAFFTDINSIILTNSKFAV